MVPEFTQSERTSLVSMTDNEYYVGRGHTEYYGSSVTFDDVGTFRTVPDFTQSERTFLVSMTDNEYDVGR